MDHSQNFNQGPMYPPPNYNYGAPPWNQGYSGDVAQSPWPVNEYGQPHWSGNSNNGHRGHDNHREGGRSSYGRGRGSGRSRNSDSSDHSQQYENDTIYVAGLTETITENDLSELFGSIGLIKTDKRTKSPKIWIYKDKETELPKGDATVTYQDPAAAKAAVDWFNGKDLKGATLKVELARRRERRDFQRGGRGNNRDGPRGGAFPGGGSNSGGGGSNFGGFPGNDIAAHSRSVGGAFAGGAFPGGAFPGGAFPGGGSSGGGGSNFGGFSGNDIAAHSRSVGGRTGENSNTQIITGSPQLSDRRKGEWAGQNERDRNERDRDRYERNDGNRSNWNEKGENRMERTDNNRSDWNDRSEKTNRTDKSHRADRIEKSDYNLSDKRDSNTNFGERNEKRNQYRADDDNKAENDDNNRSDRSRNDERYGRRKRPY